MNIYTSAGLLRVALAQKYADRHGIIKKTGDPATDYRFLWVTNFPMFEYDENEKRWVAAHHPFTSPHEEDMDKLESDPAMVRALAYDVVLNGTELGSGSVRIHRQDIQRQIFRALSMTEDEAKARFGFFLEALEYGTPPHGGIALGLDRIVMILAGAENLCMRGPCSAVVPQHPRWCLRTAKPLSGLSTDHESSGEWRSLDRTTAHAKNGDRASDPGVRRGQELL